MVAELKTMNDADAWRTPGCTGFCREIRVIEIGTLRPANYVAHDVGGHESFGMAVGMRQSARYEERVLTGPLLIRLDTMRAYRDGAVIPLTPTEWRLLAILSQRLGSCVETGDLMLGVWGRVWNTIVTNDPMHILRVNVARLRAKIGPDGRRLVETRPGLGYSLVNAPYTGPQVEP
jgi:DNA-binding response OmpR family regulator